MLTIGSVLNYYIRSEVFVLYLTQIIILQFDSFERHQSGWGKPFENGFAAFYSMNN